MDDKQKHEFEVFKEFIAVAKIKPTDIETKDPNEPDILCKINGNFEYFELGRLLDKIIQKKRNIAWRKFDSGENTVEVMSSKDKDILKIGIPERDKIIEKTDKTYTSHGIPINLLLYFDNETRITLNSPSPLLSYPDRFTNYMEANFDFSSCQFRSIYIFDRLTKRILWSWTH